MGEAELMGWNFWVQKRLVPDWFQVDNQWFQVKISSCNKDLYALIQSSNKDLNPFPAIPPKSWESSNYRPFGVNIDPCCTTGNDLIYCALILSPIRCCATKIYMNAHYAYHTQEWTHWMQENISQDLRNSQKWFTYQNLQDFMRNLLVKSHCLDSKIFNDKILIFYYLYEGQENGEGLLLAVLVTFFCCQQNTNYYVYNQIFFINL